MTPVLDLKVIREVKGIPKVLAEVHSMYLSGRSWWPHVRYRFLSSSPSASFFSDAVFVLYVFLTYVTTDATFV